MQTGDRMRCRNVGIAGRVAAQLLAVEMDGGGNHLAARQPIDAAHGAFIERSQRRTGLAQGPFQQIVLAAADDRRRIGRHHAGRPGEAREYPDIELMSREQPLARHFAAGNGARGDELIKLPLTQPEVIRGLTGGQKLHFAFVCIFMRLFN
jgi:hypothetical protein